MILTRGRVRARTPLLLAALMGIAGCAQGFDPDMRSLGGGFETASAARQTAQRPDSDARGVISYPSYQVALARGGESVGDVAARLGLNGKELARYNGLTTDTNLRNGELLALPSRVAESAGTGQSATTGGRGDITALASSAIDRSTDAPLGAPGTQSRSAGQASASGTATSARSAEVTTSRVADDTPEPRRHRVARGETAYSISRLYGVSVRSLADWNNLDPNLTVRVDQVLLIPPGGSVGRAVADNAAPGAGSRTPTPPSASRPLPAESVASAAAAVPASPDMASSRTVSSDPSKMLYPVTGAIIRPYSKGRNEGIDISAPVGSTVRAATGGEVAAITRDTDQVPILVLRHPDNLLTVYANISGITVKKGDTVKKGQTLAKVRDSNPSFVHFEVRKGFESVDPEPYLQ
ncbi:murein DD-endopeptidase MepM/ murein hydrolase activator NlpD [Brevirhabdus pacifica]|uniref:M23 family metallopeptidase n=2 Tax=Brevirhabdus pacifica TaxID=1267768 RepID=UPI000C1B967C|nr:M23 family metallopeptidase [Brevirhabdus pacifica]PJJ85208.1 murein DD-endopeptidase MepM/ murein hydrolase activator NlpD [Brevirhabdus pacifica]